MAGKKNEAAGSVSRLRTALNENALEKLYVFTGEESYLRRYYLAEVRKAVVSGGFAEFNEHCAEGKDITVQSLREMAEVMPVFSERSLIVLTDFDPFSLKEEEREAFIALIEDWPDYCCLVLHYDLSEYKPNRTMKRLAAAMQSFTVVEFARQEPDKLYGWIRRHFRERGKDIDLNACEYLTFTCGSLMGTLLPEIEKLAAYAKGERVTVEDIRAVATPMTEAVVFSLTSAVTAGKYDEAAKILGELLRQREEPIYLLAVLGNELRRIYTARLAIDGGKDKFYVMELWNMKSDYAAKLLMNAARNVSAAWCRMALKEAEKLDRRMKSENGIDSEEELKRFLMRLIREAKR